MGYFPSKNHIFISSLILFVVFMIFIYSIFPEKIERIHFFIERYFNTTSERVRIIRERMKDADFEINKVHRMRELMTSTFDEYTDSLIQEENDEKREVINTPDSAWWKSYKEINQTIINTVYSTAHLIYLFMEHIYMQYIFPVLYVIARPLAQIYHRQYITPLHLSNADYITLKSPLAIYR